MNATPDPSREPSRQKADRRGGWLLVMLGLTVALIGLVFVTLMGRSFLRARAMRDWPQVPCVILLSRIEERIHDPQSPREFRHAIEFGYEWKGERRTSNRLTLRGSMWTSRREVAERRLDEYPAGSTSTCLVHPQDPDLAVLVPDSLAPGYSIWFPALFVIGGFGIAVRAVPRRGRLSAGSSPCQSLES